MKRFDDIVSIGIIEKSFETVAHLEEHVGKLLPGFSLFAFWENRTRQVLGPGSEPAKLESGISFSTLKKVVESNSSDYALYERYREP